MKIDKRIPAPTATKTPAVKGKAGGTRASGSKAPGGESLTLTETSTQVRVLEAELAQVDVTDTQKIASVKDALAKGTFEVNAEVVADRLIDHTKEALRKRGRKK